MIASVAFRNFKALRNTSLELVPFNLVIGPNGSGKTSLIQAILRLRDLARSLVVPLDPGHTRPDSAEISFRFAPPFAELEARLACVSDLVCDVLQVRSAIAGEWEAARAQLARVRSYTFDHVAMARPARVDDAGDLAPDAGNLAAMLARWRETAPEAFARVQDEFCRLLPEFSALDVRPGEPGTVQVAAQLRDSRDLVLAPNLSQGTLYTLATLAVSFDPAPRSIVCLEEIDRGIHPRMLREIRDALYRRSFPEAFGDTRAPTQVIATTHSPYLLDLFRDHPEEVVIAQKEGTEARFERLANRADVPELLKEGSLGDMWFAGILGGVPEE